MYLPSVPPELSVVGVAVASIAPARLLPANLNLCLLDHLSHCFLVAIAKRAKTVGRAWRVHQIIDLDGGHSEGVVHDQFSSAIEAMICRCSSS